MIMKTFKHIRIGMGLSQLKLATYLGVSRSLVYFVEKGLRSLPSPALLKFAQLELKFNELKGSIPFSAEDFEKEQEQQRAQVINYMREKERLINRSNSLRIRLEKMRRAHRRCMGKVITNRAVYFNMQHIKADKGDDLWLWINIDDNAVALKYCNVGRQKVITAEIRRLYASIAILDEYIQKHMLRIEMPVARLIEAA